MARELKTKKTDESVAKFVDGIPDATMRADAKVVAKIMEKATKAKGKMWGTSIVGFGSRQYEGRTGSIDWMLVGFSPRKAALTLYSMAGMEREPELFAKLGKYKTGKGCLYIKRLTDVDVKVLEKIVTAAVVRLKESTP